MTGPEEDVERVARLAPGTPAEPEPRTLDVVAAKVGHGFPSLGIAVREAWISAA